MQIYWEANYDDQFAIINADSNQTLADITFLNNQPYYSNVVYDSDNYYNSNVSVDSYCNQQAYAYDGSASVAGLPLAHYILVSHESVSDPYEYVTAY